MEKEQSAELPTNDALRRGQFSLRSLFVLTMAAAVGAAVTKYFGTWAVFILAPATVYGCLVFSLRRSDIPIFNPSAAVGVAVAICGLPFFQSAWLVGVWLGSLAAMITAGVIAIAFGYVRGFLVIPVALALVFAAWLFVLSQIDC